MIHFEEIDEKNWRTRLDVAEDQKHYVANSAVLLARAYAFRNHRSHAYFIFYGETPVGMTLWYDYEPLDAYDLSQLFIDQHYQGRGYGKEAMKKVLAMMKQDGKYNKVILCYIEGNDAAKRMYERFGFKVTERDGDEIGMELVL